MSETQAEESAADSPDDVMNMFASVWVKVEVEDESEHEVGTCSPIQIPTSTDENPFEAKPKKPPAKSKRRFTKVLKCEHCDYTTVYKNCLDIHTTGHFNEKPYTCEECPYSTKYPSSLYRHVTIKHREKKIVPKSDKPLVTLKCDHCEYTTHFKWNLNAHKRKHKLEKQFKCPHCSYETAYRHNYLKHSKVHKEGQVFKCDKCPFITKYEGHIQRHLAKIHNEITDKAHMCDLCDFSTREKWRLNIHKQRSKQEEPLKCAYCDYETVYMCQSKKHKTSHYSEIYGNGRPMNCSNFANELQEMINNDVAMESNEANEEIEVAVRHVERNNEKHALSNNYTLDPEGVDWNSIQVLESDNKDRPFQCHMCNYTSKFKASVQRHFQRHHTGSQTRPYKCCNCDFSTKTKDQIALHNKRSQSKLLMHCSVCSFTTYFKCKYVLHQKCHYTHKCTICDYTCRHKHELTKHFATSHLGNGLKCQYCDYRASRKASVLCHETIHTGVKPFQCSFCNYSSVRKALLDKHMNRFHSKLQKDLTVVSQNKIQSLKVKISDLEQEEYGEQNPMLEDNE